MEGTLYGVQISYITDFGGGWVGILVIVIIVEKSVKISNVDCGLCIPALSSFRFCFLYLKPCY